MDSESIDSIIVLSEAEEFPKKSKVNFKSKPLPSYDDESADENDLDRRQFELHVFSPRTRRSITGRRSMRFERIESDEDEIISSEHNSNQDDRYYSHLNEFHISDKSDASKSSDIQISHSESEMKSALHDSSIVLLYSSDEEDRSAVANTSKYSSRTPAVKLIQPKLQFGTSSTKSKKIFVSRDHYNEKVDALTQVRSELKDCEHLLQSLGSTLPDKGANLSRRIDVMKNQVRTKENELATFAIEEDHLDEVMIVETADTQQPKTSDWRKEFDKIQPRFTGQHGKSTFNTQKKIILNRIEKLYKAMDKCPTESDLAEQPANLNVQLMPNQLHAIKWMRWRESQSPKGGILADDMGLGKLLFCNRDYALKGAIV